MNGGVNDCVRTRVLVLSDTHSAELMGRDGDGGEKDGDWMAFKEPLPNADVVVHCGKWKLLYIVKVPCFVSRSGSFLIMFILSCVDLFAFHFLVSFFGTPLVENTQVRS